ncbi:hypothetical protein CapIbe_007242 [Capra ibex]
MERAEQSGACKGSSAPWMKSVQASDGAREDPVFGDWECRRMTEWTARLHVAEISEPFRKAVSSAQFLRYMFLCPGPVREEGHPRGGFEGQFSPSSFTSCIKISYPWYEQVMPQVLLLETLCLEQRFRNHKS